MKHEFPASVATGATRLVILSSLLGAMISGCGGGSGNHTNTTQTNAGGSPSMTGGNGGSVGNAAGNTATGNASKPPSTSGGSGAPTTNAGAPPTMSMGGGGSMMTMPPTGTAVDSGLATLLDGGFDGGVPTMDDGSLLDMSVSTERPDQGQGDGSDVIMIGDSWMLLSVTGISLSLENPANGGNPAYTNYAVPGTQLLNGQIPSQYTQAKAVKSSIRTVIMTAGGNDVLETGLSADCAAGGTTCQMTLNAIGMALGQLWAQMSMDGVTDVVHIEYSRYAGGGLKDPAANEMGLQTICDAVPQPMHCHLLNTDTLVGMDLMADGIHPSAAACDRVAKAVTDMMQADGMRR